MNNTVAFVDAVKTKLGAVSDYDLAKKMNISRSRLSLYRTGRGTFDDEMCVRVAEILDLDSLYVLAAIHAERSQNPIAKAAWKAAFEKLGGVAATLLLGIMLNSQNPIPTTASQALDLRKGGDQSIHYAK